MSTVHDSASGTIDRASGVGWLDSPAVAGEPDPLSEVLRTVRLAGALFFVWDARWPFATPVPAGDRIAPVILPGAQQIVSFHVLVGGSCWGGLLSEAPLRLETGDVLLIPRGDAYLMASSGTACRPSPQDMDASVGFFRQMAAGELPNVVTEGGGGPETTRVVCGFLACDMLPFNPVLSALPRLLRLRPPADPSTDRLRSLTEYALSETQQPRAGGHCVLVRLSELMFVEVLRRALVELPAAPTGWLAAMRDPVIGRALLHLHRRPSDRWTVESLAAAVNLSRSQLAQRFADLLGEPPIQYLTRWRLQLAARLLADGDTKIAAIASRVGYESVAAFSRAFKRFAGVPPVDWRRSARTARSEVVPA